MLDQPIRTLDLGDDWGRIILTTEWMAERAGSHVYLRQIHVPGVDTKFIEGHRRVLADLLDRILTPDAIDTTAAKTDLERRYGFLGKPARIRLRHFGDASALPTALSDIMVRIDELAAVDPGVSNVYVVENQVTYLAFPPVDDAIVIFGRGYGLPRLGELTWLHEKSVHYWGDIDTHGFAILDQLRRALPHTESFLMDRGTLLAHETQWIQEPEPVNTPLELLTSEESALYRDLVEDTLGPAVRLEQERVNYARISEAIGRTASCPVG